MCTVSFNLLVFKGFPRLKGSSSPSRGCRQEHRPSTTTGGIGGDGE